MTTKKPNLASKLKPYDCFGKMFKFNFSGESADITTPVGGLLTIIMLMITTPILVIFCRRWIDTSKPTVSVNNLIKDRAERYKLDDGNIFTGLLLFNGADFVHFNDVRKYATLRGERLTRFETPNGEIRENHSPFPYVHCAKMDQNYTNEVDRLSQSVQGGTASDLDYGFCPDYH